MNCHLSHAYLHCIYDHLNSRSKKNLIPQPVSSSSRKSGFIVVTWPRRWPRRQNSPSLIRHSANITSHTGFPLLNFSHVQIQRLSLGPFPTSRKEAKFRNLKPAPGPGSFSSRGEGPLETRFRPNFRPFVANDVLAARFRGPLGGNLARLVTDGDRKWRFAIFESEIGVRFEAVAMGTLHLSKFDFVRHPILGRNSTLIYLTFSRYCMFDSSS